MFPHGLRDRSLGLCQVQKLGDRSHVDLFGAGCAVAAVHAVSFPADIREGGKGCRVILFFVGGLLIGGAFPELFHRMGSGQDAGHTRTCQGVMETPAGGERFSGRGQGSVQEIAAAEGLHDGDAHAHSLTDLVELLAFRVHVDKMSLVIFLIPELFHVLARRLQVVAGIHAEHQDLDGSTSYGGQGGFRVVAA